MPALDAGRLAMERGVSLEGLADVRNDIVEGRAAPGVELATLLRPVAGLPAGATVRVTASNAHGPVAAATPFLGDFGLPPRATAPKDRRKWTVEDVCHYLVLPATAESRDCYLDHLPEHCVGPAFRGAFVSQARGSVFSDLVNSLLSHFALLHCDLATTYVWLDAFSANQTILMDHVMAHHDPDSSPSMSRRKEPDACQRHFAEALHELIAEYDQVLVYLNSWDEPLAATRLWCVWEVVGILRADKEIALLFPLNENRRFVETLREDYELVYEAFARIDVYQAACEDPANREYLVSRIAQTAEEGFVSVNSAILKALREWVISTTLEQAEKERETPAEPTPRRRSSKFHSLDAPIRHSSRIISSLVSGRRKTRRERNPQEQQCRFLLEGGQLLRTMHHLQQAMDLLEAALQAYAALPGVEGLRGQARALDGIALVYQARRINFDLAEKNFDLALHLLEKAGDAKSVRTARVLDHKGRVCYDYRNFLSANACFQQALQIELKTVGQDTLTTAETIGNIGNVYLEEGRFDMALERFEKSLDIKQRILEERNVSLGYAYFNISRVLDRLNRDEEAISFAERARKIWVQNWGKMHPFTKRAESQIRRLRKAIEASSGAQSQETVRFSPDVML